jgi:hypothetical protein
MARGSPAWFAGAGEDDEVAGEDELALFSEFMRQLLQRSVRVHVKASSDGRPKRVRCVMRKIERSPNARRGLFVIRVIESEIDGTLSVADEASVPCKEARLYGIVPYLNQR